MKIDKFAVIICIQIFLLCLVFFCIGYGNAYKTAVTYTNEFIEDNCIRNIGYEDMDFDVEQQMFNINITFGGQNE